ncbi:hypothetical protein DES51_105243 [Dielma fastidiosa]|uniref:Uncharacterized protein n=1 Tax=Dielma fastidiosa TaxID=1034346 RepID=A0A318KPU3_9FIRM|nr:hypothetical protein DES51_105243 [Dielma fastidiosa]
MNHCVEIKYIVNEFCHQITVNYSKLTVEIITNRVLSDAEKEFISNAISRYFLEN